jgi:hypothetical protein
LQSGGTSVVVTGLALRPAETGQLIRLGLPEAETSRRFRSATQVGDGVVESVLDAGQLAEHRFAANVQPRVVDGSQPVLDVTDRCIASTTASASTKHPKRTRRTPTSFQRPRPIHRGHRDRGPA